jgi:predicted MFS family arabinose efflux permease
MLDLSLFRSGTFSGANVAMLLVALAMFGIFFYNSLFFQNILGYSAIQTGALFLPMTVLIILIAPQAGRFSDRIVSRWLVGAGMTLVSVSLILFAQLDRGTSFWSILPALLVGGSGMALTMTPTTAAVMPVRAAETERLPRRRSMWGAPRKMNRKQGTKVTHVVSSAPSRAAAQGLRAPGSR